MRMLTKPILDFTLTHTGLRTSIFFDHKKKQQQMKKLISSRPWKYSFLKNEE